MYKVFIDHKPILFVNESEVLPNLVSVRIETLKNFSFDIKAFMSQVTIDYPLLIVCEDKTESFNSVFNNFKLVEASGGVVRRRDKILMIFRNGLWDIPKGKLESGENYETAGIREVEEECGLINPTIETFLCETCHTYLFKGDEILKKTTWFVMNYAGEEDLIPQTEEGITEVKWCDLKEFYGVRGNTYGSINEVIDQYVSFLDSQMGL